MRPIPRRLVSPLLTVLSLLLMFGGCGDNFHVHGEAAITSFSIAGHHGVISGDNITVMMPTGTDVTNLAPSVSIIGSEVTPRSGEAQDFTSPVMYTVVNDDGTRTRTYAAAVVLDTTNPPSSAKEITSFSFEATDNSGLANDVTGTINGTDITATVPFNTNVTALVATFTTTGKSVAVGGTAQVSGTTANNFTDPVPYVVTAEDGSKQTYTVTITVAANSAKELNDFAFLMADNGAAGLTSDVPGTPNGTTITATVPFGTDVTKLVASFTTTGVSVKIGSALQTSGSTVNNFTGDVVYTVTAGDNSTKNYTIIVSIAPSSAKELQSFGFTQALNSATTADGAGLDHDVAGTFSTGTGNMVTVILPNGTRLVDLIPTFSFVGKEVRLTSVSGPIQTSGVDAQTFTTDLTYTVVAQDNSSIDYVVHVDNSLSGDKQINSFVIGSHTGSFNGTLIDVVVGPNDDLSALIPTIGFTGDHISPASGVATNFTNSATTRVTYTVFAADGTSKDYFVKVTKAISSNKEITRFVIQGLDGSIVNIGTMGGTINLTMPKGTDLSALSPHVEYNGVTVSPADNEQVDFSKGSVSYVVTAADNSTRTYTVSVGTVAGNGTSVINSFTITVNGVTYPAAITNGTAGTITLVLPKGTDLSFQTPTIVINGSSITPPSFVPQDFRQPVTYVVTAADGSQHTYTATVTDAP